MFDRNRLLRDEWTAPELAKELYAMLDPSTPLLHKAPITIENGNNTPAITVRNYGGSSLAIQSVDGEGAETGYVSYTI